MIAGFFDSIPAMILLTGCLVGISSAVLGSLIVLRGNSMLTDAISHSIVFGIIITWMLTAQISGPLQLLGAALTGVLTVLAVEWLARSGLVKMDAAIGLVFPALFAAGVLLIALHARDIHLHVDSVLLGEIGLVWLHRVSLWGLEIPVAVATLGVVTAINLAFVLGFWKELKLSSFDPGLALVLGFAPGALHYALLTLTSITAVAAFDAVGAVLFIAFVIVPPATAYLLTRRLWLMMVLAVALSLAACLSGYGLAVRWDVSIGGMMASMTGLWFALALLFAPGRGLLAQGMRRGRARADHDSAVLVAHLATHQGTDAMARENTLQAVMADLGWSHARARAAILRAHDRGLIERRAGLLSLRPKGAAMARETFGPGRAGP